MDAFDTKTTCGKVVVGIIIAIILISLCSTILSFSTGSGTIIVTPTISYVSGVLYSLSTVALIAFVIYMIIKAMGSSTTHTTN